SRWREHGLRWPRSRTRRAIAMGRVAIFGRPTACSPRWESGVTLRVRKLWPRTLDSRSDSAPRIRFAPTVSPNKAFDVIDSRQRKSLATIRVSLTPSTPSADTTPHRDAATVRNERRLRKTPEFGTRRLDLAPSEPRNTLRTCPL